MYLDVPRFYRVVLKYPMRCCENSNNRMPLWSDYSSSYGTPLKANNNAFLGNIIEVFLNIDIETHNSRPHLVGLQALSLDQCDALGASYQQIDIGAGELYVALDRNYRRLLVVFANPFSAIYGEEVGERIVKQATDNITKYSTVGFSLQGFLATYGTIIPRSGSCEIHNTMPTRTPAAGFSIGAFGRSRDTRT